MTAAEVTGWLARLEETHKAATPGPWSQHPSDGEYVIAGATNEGGDFDYAADVADTYAYRKRGGFADAAAIVAAHNALPQLVAAVRGVLDRHYPHGRNIHGDEVCAAGHNVLEPWPCPEYVAVAVALTGEFPKCGDQSVGGCARPAGHGGGHVAPCAYRPESWPDDRSAVVAAMGAEVTGR